ncbi:hypothetical protein [Leptospira noguchii]|uniref:Uncharacterized protein n=1 Tax=Leptospira noguchii str. 2001034031 TaxID=1193053 RepID=M6YPK3_9LEPT|nr:hypothetical protein [Leptospira noguchii]EMO91494.1 hypothetical protein LEP1GSC024_2603 [Leptospira noguchii str. 2001034031]UOG59012.1 hypothetical protein MAL07_09180 [Leptospira noguchii]
MSKKIPKISSTSDPESQGNQSVISLFCKSAFEAAEAWNRDKLDTEIA